MVTLIDGLTDSEIAEARKRALAIAELDVVTFPDHCEKIVNTGTVLARCGEQWGGAQICDPCLARAEREYPQGWRAYPGDTCKHGVYVGGSGADYMCGPCEDGN